MRINTSTKIVSTAILLSSISLFSYALYAGSEKNKTKVELSSTQDKVNYSIGLEMGKQFKETDFEFLPEAFIQGIKDGQAGTSILTDEEMQKVRMDFQQATMKKMQERHERLAKENLEESNQFFEANSKKPDINVTNSGLQYKVIKTGKGSNPTEMDMVTVNYVGKTLDGKEFDSSYKRKEPTKLQLNRVIPGWKEALMMMTPGSKWEVYIPPKLAYGEAGAGQVIEPNSALIFEIELVSIEKKKELENKPKGPSMQKED